MSGFVCLFMCILPWPDYSRLRSENSLEDWKFTEDVKILILYLSTQYETIMPHSMNLPLLTFLSFSPNHTLNS